MRKKKEKVYGDIRHTARLITPEENGVVIKVFYNSRTEHLCESPEWGPARSSLCGLVREGFAVTRTIRNLCKECEKIAQKRYGKKLKFK